MYRAFGLSALSQQPRAVLWRRADGGAVCVVVVAGDDDRRYRGPDGGFREITGDSIVVVWLTPEKGDGLLGFFVSEFLAFERANNAQEFRGIGMTADRDQHATNRADCASAIFTAPFNRR